MVIHKIFTFRVFIIWFRILVCLRLGNGIPGKDFDRDDGDHPEFQRIVEGDMIYYKEKNPTKAGAINENGFRESLIWPNKTVIYVVTEELRDQTDHFERIKQAMRDIENAVPNCVKYRERTASDGKNHYTNLQSSKQGCYSTIGYNRRIGTDQVINFNQICASGNMVHELIHTLGFFHEHTRNDRDDYVRVDYQNILDGRQINYDKDEKRYNSTNYNVRYNYDSIMHYPLRAAGFAVDPSKPIMYSKKNRHGLGYDKDIEYEANRDHLSAGDLFMIARRYDCSTESLTSRSSYPVTGATPKDTSEHEMHGPSAPFKR